MSGSIQPSSSDVRSLDYPYSDARALVIFGSRGFGDGLDTDSIIDYVLQCIRVTDPEFDVIVSGGAEGADKAAELVAGQLGVPFHAFDVGSVTVSRGNIRRALECTVTNEIVSSFSERGKGAYLYRNNIMAEIADVGIALWDGESSGTEQMISACEDRDVNLSVFKYDQ